MKANFLKADVVVFRIILREKYNNIINNKFCNNTITAAAAAIEKSSGTISLPIVAEIQICRIL